MFLGFRYAGFSPREENFPAWRGRKIPHAVRLDGCKRFLSGRFKVRVSVFSFQLVNFHLQYYDKKKRKEIYIIYYIYFFSLFFIIIL